MVKMSRRTFLRTIAVGSGTMAMMYTGMDVHAAGAETLALRIVHTNDHHARIEPVLNGTALLHGGVSRRKTLIDAIRKDNGNNPMLLLDAGDVFQGTLFFNQYRGLADLEFYNAFNYDAVGVGNHEFDLGPQPLADFISRANFPMVSANIKVPSGSPLAGKITPWVVKWVGGQPIGIIGVTTEDTPETSSPGPDVRFTSAVEAVKLGVADLRGRGVNKFIVLSHLGVFADRALGRAVDGIQVIIGGHTHTPMGAMVSPANASQPYPEVVPSPSGKPVIVATDWEWGRWLGDLTIGFDANGDVTRVVAGHPMEVSPSIAPDPGFENRINVLRTPIDALRKAKVGVAAVALNGARADVRSKETNLGNLISDALLYKTEKLGTQISIQNGGSIRTGIPAGDVTLGQVIDVMPFGNTLVVVTITGAQLREALENGVSQVETGAGRFPQVGGMRYTWDPKAAVGSRIVSAELKSGSGYTPIVPSANYKVAATNFLVNGGDGYTVLGKGSARYDVGFIDSDALAEYITAKSPVSPQVEGRVTTK